jgi:hypothetical protein
MVCGGHGAQAGFEIGFLDPDAGETRAPLADVTQVAFERIAPVRSFPSYKGQRNFPGFYYSATMDAHVPFESWLERDTAMALDFRPDVVSFAAQPFWPDTDRVRTHASTCSGWPATGIAGAFARTWPGRCATPSSLRGR